MKPEQWQATMGSFRRDHDGTIHFRGEAVPYGSGDSIAPPAMTASIGNYISSVRFEGGEIRAAVQFEQPQDLSACQILFYYEPNLGGALGSPNFVTAGLSSRGFLYSINSFFQGRWTVVAGTGMSQHLLENGHTEYRLRVGVEGSLVTLSVDDVEVLKGIIASPLPQEAQVGLWCTGYTNIRIADYDVEAKSASAFVVMPFSAPYTDINEEVIRVICEGFHLKALRGDDVHGPGIIVSDIAREIASARVVIAEVTEPNPNVYNEVGYAHALQKDTILIAQKGTKLPFDIAPFRILFYENTIPGKRRVESALEKHLEAILGRKPTKTSSDRLAK